MEAMKSAKSGFQRGTLFSISTSSTLFIRSVSAALGSPPKYSKASIKADQRRRITALDERHKAHARVAEDRGKAVEFVGRPILLILKLPPIELDRFCRLG